MRPAVLTLILISFFLSAWAQCPQGDITFYSQGQVDNFVVSYPNCTEIAGDVIIGTNTTTNIVNLNGLSQITTIGGRLFIRHNIELTDLAGLNNLTSIGESVWIQANPALTSLIGLNNLASVNGYLHIESNGGLTNLTGLNNLISVGRLYIESNSGLINLTGLNNLTTIGGDFLIERNTSLTSLA